MTLQKNRLKAWLFARAVKVASLLQAIPGSVTPAPFRVMQIGSMFWQSRALYVAARLDIAGALGDSPRSADELATQLAINPDGAFRLMRMLAAMGVFREIEPRVFVNNKLSNCLREDHADSIRAMVLMHNSEEMSRPWFEELENGIRDGSVPFQNTHGQELFDYMSSHAAFDSLFASAMDRVEVLSGGDVIADDFDWSRFDRVLDIGGSKGSKTIALLKRHPHLHGVVVDRPQIIEEAKTFWQDEEQTAVLSRIAFAPGDIRLSIPQAGSSKDIYMLNAVLHGFDDPTCQEVLSNLADACRGTGALVMINEIVLPEIGSDLNGASFDMQMFMGTSGRERTLSEFQSLFDRCGLTLVEVVRTRSFASMVIVKAR